MEPVGDDVLVGLLMASAQGDQHAFAELYRVTAPRVNAVVRRLVGAPTDASEVLQETFVKIWYRATKFDPQRGAAIHWIFAIARNTAIDHLRSRTRVSASLDEAVELPAVADLGVLAGLDVRRCVALLEPQYASVISLAFYSGYSHAEMARRLDTPLGTIKSRVRRALSTLKQCLDSCGGH